MATAAFEFAIPAPHNASFTNGEKGVGKTSAAVGEYRFTRQFYNERGAVYQIKLWCKQAATVLVGANAASLVPQLSAPSNTVILTQIYLPAGNQRIDIHMSNTAAGSNFGFAMLLFHPDRAVYASDNEGWVYNVGSTVFDNEVPAADEANTPVFSFLPNWADGVLERVSYLTDIPTSETGSEQRRSLRRHPRREFDVSFMRHGVLRSRLNNFLLGIGRRVFWMPMWQEQFRLKTTLGVSVQFPEGSISMREFRVGDRVLATAGDPDDYEVLNVQSINYDTDTLTWSSPPIKSWVAGSRIIPMRRARIENASDHGSPTDRVGVGKIRFSLVDPDFCFGASWGLCSPVWTFKIDRSQEIQFSFDRISYTLDNDTGPVEISDPGNNPVVTMRSAVLLRGREQLVAMRRFIDVAEGRASRFWMPSLMHDVEPLTATVQGTQIEAAAFGYADYIQGIPDQRSVLTIILDNGMPPIHRTVTSVQKVGTSEFISVSESIPPIPSNSIRRIQFMVPSRFDQDTFEFHHKVDEAAAVGMSVVTRSVDGSGMPAIDCPEMI